MPWALCSLFFLFLSILFYPIHHHYSLEVIFCHYFHWVMTSRSSHPSCPLLFLSCLVFSIDTLWQTEGAQSWTARCGGRERELQLGTDKEAGFRASVEDTRTKELKEEELQLTKHPSCIFMQTKAVHFCDAPLDLLSYASNRSSWLLVEIFEKCSLLEIIPGEGAIWAFSSLHLPQTRDQSKQGVGSSCFSLPSGSGGLK